MNKFERILKRAKRKSEMKITKDMHYSEISVQPFFRLVKEYFENNPDSSNSEAYENFFELFNTSNQELTYLPTIKSDTLRLNICEFLLRNPDELKSAYDKIHREEMAGKSIDIDSVVSYSSNRLMSARTAILQAIKAIRDTKKALPKEYREAIEMYVKAPKKTQNDIKRSLDSATRREIDDLKDYFSGDEYTQLATFLKKKMPVFEKELKDDYIESLTFLGSRFKEFELLEKYASDQSKMLERLGLTELSYPVDDEKSTKGSISLESLFKRETLEQIDVNKLSMLNAFWINRYTKEIEAMNQSFFIMNSLNLWSAIKVANPDAKTGRISVDIDEKELENLYLKMYFLQDISQGMIDEFHRKTLKEQEAESTVIGKTGKRTTARKVETTDFIVGLNEEIGSDYLEYFENLDSELSHNFINDFDNYRILDNSVHNAYRFKDLNMIAILSNLQKINFSKNWGIILEDGKDIKSSKKILLGIDYPGLNMPVRLHIDKSVVEEFFKANKNTSLVPIYEGNEDFRYLGQLVTTQVLMPFSKPQIEGLSQIEARQKPDSKTKNLVEHLRFLQNPEKYPEHLKEEKVIRKKGKPKIVRKPREKRFVDLSTGSLYTQDKEGQFIEIIENTTEKGEQYE